MSLGFTPVRRFVATPAFHHGTTAIAKPWTASPSIRRLGHSLRHLLSPGCGRRNASLSGATARWVVIYPFQALPVRMRPLHGVGAECWTAVGNVSIAGLAGADAKRTLRQAPDPETLKRAIRTSSHPYSAHNARDRAAVEPDDLSAEQYDDATGCVIRS